MLASLKSKEAEGAVLSVEVRPHGAGRQQGRRPSPGSTGEWVSARTPATGHEKTSDEARRRTTLLEEQPWACVCRVRVQPSAEGDGQLPTTVSLGRGWPALGIHVTL